MLLGAVSAEQMPKAVEGAIQSLDHNLARLSRKMFKLTQQLFDVLALPLTRDAADIGRWRTPAATTCGHSFRAGHNSFIGTVADDHRSLMQLAMITGRHPRRGPIGESTRTAEIA